MIWTLRYISVHLWIATLFTLPLSFYILPGLTRFFPGINSLTTGIVTFLGILIMMGFLMDAAAKKAVINLIKEGQIWERSGLFQKAEKKYIKALRIYDTFLLWPFSAKKMSGKISGILAKFKLNTGLENQNFNLATAVYLKMNPEDGDIAQLWLLKLRQSATVTSVEQDVLSLLVEKHYSDRLLSSLMVDIFLGLERKDFTAKKLYLQVLKDPVFEKRYSKKIEHLIGKSDDSLQLEISFLQPIKKSSRKGELGKRIQSIAGKAVYFLRSLVPHMGSILRAVILSGRKFYGYIKDHEKVQIYLKAGFLGIISLWFGIFMITTLSHMFKSNRIEKEKVKLHFQVPKPFTIQVSAYLNQKHADRYVSELKQKGVKAIVKKVAGGGKTWFVVRVSEFADKKSAAAYGQKLKQEKIIDDFFVNNK